MRVALEIALLIEAVQIQLPFPRLVPLSFNSTSVEVAQGEHVK